MAPPFPPEKVSPAVLPEKVLFVTTRVPPGALKMAPAQPLDPVLPLPANVLLATRSVPLLFQMAPPIPALLPENVVLLRVSVPPSLKMAPPVLAEKVLLVAVRVPLFPMAPPKPRAELL